MSEEQLIEGRKKKYPYLLPALDVYKQNKIVRASAVTRTLPLYKDHLFKLLDKSYLREIRRKSFINTLHTGIWNISTALQILNQEKPLSYLAFSGHGNFNKDWQGRSRPECKTGRSEAVLYKALLKKRIAVIPQYSCSDFRYTLDFAYINSSTMVKINIEVDENYHFMPEQIVKDRFRNFFLSKRGWTIIRFTEQQVLLHSDKCAELIYKIIHTGKVDSGLWHDLNYIEPLQIIKKRSFPRMNMIKTVFKRRYPNDLQDAKR